VEEKPLPPKAKQQPHTTLVHGQTLVDPYYWLREKTNPDVRAYLDAENAYTKAVMQPTEGLQKKLYEEMLGRIKQTDLSVPYPKAGYYYYSRTVEGKQYSILCRKKGSLDAPEEVMLDLNTLANGRKFLSVGAQEVSDDGHLLAYSLDSTGFREYELFVKDLRSGESLPDRIGKVAGVEWAADGKHLFYTTEDAAKRSYRVYRHLLGTAKEKDVLLLEEKDELFRLGLGRTLDNKYILVSSGSFESGEVRLLPAYKPTAELQLLLPREPKHRYRVVGHREGFLYILTNKDAKNFKLVKAPVAEPAKWEEVIAHRDAVLLESATILASHLVLGEKENGLRRLAVLAFPNLERHEIAMAEPSYSLFPATNAEFNTAKFRYQYTSFITPRTVYEYDLGTREKKLLKQDEVFGGYDPNKYQAERVWVTARDGVKVPLSLVYRKDLKKDGSAPCMLQGYGAYGFGVPVSFSSNNLSLLDRGFVVALAHIRGGNDLGERWHDDGKMMRKKNTFFDFIDCGNWLCAQKYTSHHKLAIQGGSAGGLLIGAVLNLAPPDFCQVAVLDVPFVDVINTMLDESLPLTVGEFQEWGNPKIKEQYDYMKTYCPYSNLGTRVYPHILVNTSYNDSQVMYWEPAKYVAKLRTLKTDQNRLLFKCNMAAGHGGASGRYDHLKERALTLAFVLSCLEGEKASASP
jgi:oligopeptidase B